LWSPAIQCFSWCCVKNCFPSFLAWNFNEKWFEIGTHQTLLISYHLISFLSGFFGVTCSILLSYLFSLLFYHLGIHHHRVFRCNRDSNPHPRGLPPPYFLKGLRARTTEQHQKTTDLPVHLDNRDILQWQAHCNRKRSSRRCRLDRRWTIGILSLFDKSEDKGFHPTSRIRE